MRTYGRTRASDGTMQWVQVTTDSNGKDDAVWVTTLIQNLLLNLGESPFYADRGIPARQSVMNQIFPDFYVLLTQKNFAPYFASLLVSKQPVSTPTYDIKLTTSEGFKLNARVQVAY